MRSKDSIFGVKLDDGSFKRISLDLDKTDFHIAWQKGKLLVLWNGVNISEDVYDVEFKLDHLTGKKSAEITVMANFLIPRFYEVDWECC